MADNYIDTLHDLLVSKRADISVCNFIRTEIEEIEVSSVQTEIYEFSNIQALENLCGKFNVQLVISCGKLYSRELFNEVRFPVGKLHEDEFTTYKILYKSRKIVFTTEQLYYYWFRDDSITGTRFNLKSRLDVLQAIEERAISFKILVNLN